MPELLLTKEHGEHEFQWQETYGQVYPIKGCFGEDRLMVSDPLALKYILNSQLFAFGPSHAKVVNVLLGHGNMLLKHGASHRHLRNLINPAFSSKNVRASLASIKEIGRKLADRWEALGFPGTTVDISPTLNDAALDATSDVILEHPFNALTGQSEVARIQRAIVDSVSSPTRFGQLIDAVLPYIPDSIVHWACNLPIPGLRTMQEYKKLTDELGGQLAQHKRNSEGSGIDQSFISGLVRGNANDNKDGVTDHEIGVHIRTILVAGQDTTGSTLGWILYRLAQMTDWQRELREEIRIAGLKSEPDYDSMSLLNAIINETLRFYPTFPMSERVATEDCVLPLSQPITTTTGVQISEIPIKKGQCVYIAIATYNRLSAIWGPDAGEFRPSRWLGDEPCKGPALGPHASLLTFFGGPSVCLGWRFAILQLQVIVAEIVSRFVLSLPEDDSVRARLAVTLVPETADGTRHLPVHVEAFT